ncbi:MAG: hypothetical protein A2Z04_01170 [Chloroflexi bacterium RBG_16_57_9]|nr:MAG: hypothetical protein A2Z04_01170 [Chloroflexi bacterium RBG_16_57_9]
MLFSLFSLARTALADGRQVNVLTIKGAVTPIMVSYIQRGIQEAQADNAKLLVIQLDTPGGSVNLMEDIVRHIQDSNVPVAVFVAPPGAKAASAGTFIVLGAHVAAMAPNTSIGAASPVGSEGQELPQTSAEKAKNVLAAQIKNLAARRGEKAVEWAEQAVREAKAATASEALELGVIDVIANNVDDLLTQLQGMQIQVKGQTVTLMTQQAAIRPVDMTPIEGFLHTITDPNIAFILLTLGLNGLLFELASPGAILPGVVGGICLLLAIYSLGVLDVNYVGVSFIILAFILFIADVKAPTHGLLTLGGTVSFVLGALLLFNSPYYQVSRTLIVSVALVTAGFFGFAVQAAVRILRKKPTTGYESLIGAMAEARSDLTPGGMVWVVGELWRARVEVGQVKKGEPVRVVGVMGLELRVQQVRPASLEKSEHPEPASA